MKAIPTPYGGCRFRSRLEARWAAFFDLAALDWDYEPIDLDGWAPDFSIHSAGETVYAEVKPVEMEVDPQIGPIGPKKDPSFQKAEKFWKTHWVLKLGMCPPRDADYFTIGALMDPPEGVGPKWFDVAEGLKVNDATTLWRIAGARVQWRPAA